MNSATSKELFLGLGLSDSSTKLALTILTQKLSVISGVRSGSTDTVTPAIEIPLDIYIVLEEREKSILGRACSFSGNV